MTIKWERNSRVADLLNRGKITDEDVIKKTTTDNFPEETATVRMQNMKSKTPFITVHIRGKGVRKTNSFNSYSWIHAATMRVNMGSPHYEEQHGLSGELSSEYSFLDVHNAITKVRETLGL
tara:strand:- start:791 stop:1153 length:363 start_codon:yes stop_codon:yes gene_type:complete